jgi:dihydromethanopterin reductase
MSIVNLIAAVGRQGQLGLEGDLPWHNPADLAFFKSVTNGSILVFGQRTLDRMNAMAIGFPRRLRRNWPRHIEPGDLLKDLHRKYPDWPIWIAGGAATYRAFAPFVDGVKIISLIDYDGPADTWFPFDAFGMKDLRA